MKWGYNLPSAIAVDLGRNPGSVVFNTREALERWAHDEMVGWMAFPLTRVPEASPFYRAARDQVDMAVALANYLNENRAFFAREIQDQVLKLLNRYQQGDVIHRATTEGQRILKLAAEAPEEGAALLWAMQHLRREKCGSANEDWARDGTLRRSRGRAIEAIARAATSSDSWGADDIPSRQAALSAMLADLTGYQSKWDEELSAARKIYREDRLTEASEMNKLRQEFREGHAVLLEETTKKINELGRLETVYKQKIQLEAPVEYWRKKAERHRQVFFQRGIGMIAIVGAPFLVAVVSLAAGLGHRFLETQAKLATGGLGVLLILAAIYLASVRLIMREFQTERALITDAEERVVMAQTFLALIQDKKIGDDERKLVLSALFRPFAAGAETEGVASLADAASKIIAAKPH